MKYTKEKLQPLVELSTSFADLARRLGLAPIGSNTMNLSKRCKQHGIDISHFTGQAHMRGKPSRNKLTVEDVLVVGTKERGRIKASVLTRALLESGVEYKCDVCDLGPEWVGRPLRFQVDHRDGQYWNNTKTNLRFICPNCHTQTDNWGKKNKGS